MPRLSSSQQAAQRQIRSLFHRGLPLALLGEQLFELLSDAVPHDGGFISMLDPATLLFNRLIGATPEARQNAKHFLEHTYLHDPLAALLQPSQFRAELPIIALFPQIEKSIALPTTLQTRIAEDAHCRAFYATTIPAGGVIRMGFKARHQWVAGLEMIRADASHGFKPTEIEFLKIMSSEIGTELYSALQRERLKRTPFSTPSTSIGILIIDSAGGAQFTNDIAEQWLSILYALQPQALEKLPLPIMTVIAALRQTAKPAPIATLTIETAVGQVTLEATVDHEHGTTAIAFVPVRHTLPAQIPDEWLLSKQETKVVQLLVQGCSNDQISKALFITTNTVQTHVQRIYEKVGVTTRSQLIAAYFSAAFL